MTDPDIWMLDTHSDSTHGATHAGGSGGVFETTDGREPGPIVAAIEASNWTRDDVELALELAQLVVYVALAYAVLTNE